MGLFDKKYCDICGEKIGLFGNRKLDDGNLCKNCAAKLSPWFSDRRHSTVEDIRQQLEYREANKEAVAAFHTTMTLGTDTKILLDEDNQKFMVTSARDLAAANPDVLDYSQITGCNVDVSESRSEMMRKGPDGKEISYNPPQYEHSYDIFMVLQVNHPYFDEIRFKLNNTDITVRPNLTVGSNRGMMGGMNRPMPAGARPSAVSGRPVPGATRPGAAPTRPVPGAARPGAVSGRPMMNTPMTTQVISSSDVDPNTNADYVRFMQMGEEIRYHLLNVRQEYREDVEAAANMQAVVCPWCGATTMPDANGCCEYCGGAVTG